MLGRLAVHVELGRPTRAENIDVGIDLGLKVGLSKPAQSLWVVVRAWLLG